MNLDALKEINKNHEELLEESAKNNGSDPEVVKGIALKAASRGYDELSKNQKYHFDNSIRGLIENVQCEGYTHEFDETPSNCEAILKDEELVECYQNDVFYCEQCQGQSAADAHTKEQFFKD